MAKLIKFFGKVIKIAFWLVVKGEVKKIEKKIDDKISNNQDNQ